MATSFPTSLDSLTNPTATDTLDSPPHDTQHADANDAIEALQAKVGADSSAVTSSHDYKITTLESGLSTAQSDITTLESDVAGLVTGKILQVQTATYSTQQSTTSSSLTNTGLNKSITPSATSSKILVIMSFTSRTHTVSSFDAKQSFHAITRNGSTLFEQITGNYWDSQTATTRYITTSSTLVYVDSPSTTSSVNYRLRHRVDAGTLYSFYNNRNASITLLEIGA